MPTTPPLIRIGVSSCLLGQNVRYDGGNTKNAFITDELAGQFAFVPYCPEVAIGMGIPRPPIQLVDCQGELRALGIDNPNVDMTAPLRAYGRQMQGEIADLAGYIFKRNSPSCGITEVKVLAANNRYELRGRGVFAAEIMQLLPDLPVIDEQGLLDVTRRRQFIAAVKHYDQVHPRR